MASYATIEDIQKGFPMTESEKAIAEALIEEAALLIDAYNANASKDAKRIVSCKIIRRAIGESNSGFPMGSTQGTVSALGYSQSFTNSSGGSGELYLGKSEKMILGNPAKIGTHSVLES